jgi:tRNA(Ile)-lysidine synthase
LAAEPAQALSALTLDEFTALIDDRFASALSGQEVLAAGVSGGPDSMALLRLLSGWAERRGVTTIYALSVDHGLRPEAANEVKNVAEWVKDWPRIRHISLKWEGEKPEKRIQEEARGARYDLMGNWCRENGVRHLFLGHHQDDQAETFLLRLAMGSGLDGLAAMRSVQVYNGTLTLLRPLLTVSKERLLATCAAQAIPFVTDPSNKSDNFARVRLRKSLAAMEAEGLSNKRLAVTAERLDRARNALEIITEKAQESALVNEDTNRIIYKYEFMLEWPGEIVLRIITGAMKALRPEGEYLPRMEKIESLFRDFMNPAPFTKRTLGGLIFERDDKEKHFIVRIENMDKNAI